MENNIAIPKWGVFMRRRIKVILAIYLAIFIFLAYRLFLLQVIENDEMLQKASAQRNDGVSVNNLRGTIFDRNLIPLTDNDEKTELIVMPKLLDNPEKDAKFIAKEIGVDYDTLFKEIKLDKPLQYEMDYAKAINIKKVLKNGISVITTYSRYGTSSIARHVIGYVNGDGTGQSGIEKGYDSYLKRNGHQEIGILEDGFKKPLTGFGFRAADTYLNDQNTNVKLTLDYHFQNIIERAFDNNGYIGAAVLLDVKSGDILAMVSRPDYDQNNVAKYFTSPNKELINRALYPYPIGSIFKIIIAEAAFETGMVKEDDMFYCPGYIMVDGQMKKCASYNEGGHGNINFANAFAESCNTTFITVGLKLGFNNIVEIARKFGLGQSLGLDIHGLPEDPGLIPYKKYFSNREVANMSIGQGEILVTPLQAANLIAIVANNGVQKHVNIVDSIVDNDGNVIKKIKSDESSRALPSESIQRVKKLMSLVTKSGTGVKANLEEYGGAAGKTSTAETGRYVGDEQILDAWFGGYFPENNPQYSLVIVIENGKAGSQAAGLFADIAAAIMNIGERCQ